MEWTLEVVVVPVADVDRAKAFYADQLLFHVDHDTVIGPTARLVQLTPRGSGCSIVLGPTPMTPGSLQGVQLIVRDIRAAVAELGERGVDVGAVAVMGPTGPRPATDDDDLNNVGFAAFTDPDGNGWTIQQITARG